MKQSIIFSIFLIGATLFGFAQAIDKPALDAYLENLEAQHLFMGSIAISKGEKLVYSKSVGYIDVEKKQQVVENSHFRIGSITKTFTAVLILKAIEQGRLTLDQTIEQFFPDIPYADKISIELLLRHRSGLFNPRTRPELMKLRSQTLTREATVKIIESNKSDFYPDAKTAYNNVNYLLLTFILEEVFEKSFDDLLKAYIVTPLGLKNTFYDEKLSDLNNEIKSYRYRGNWKLLPKTNASVVLGAGAMISTADDLVRFSDALFHDKLVSEKELALMTDFQKRYGLGLTVKKMPEGVGIGHAGAIDGNRAMMMYFEVEDVSMAVVSNANIQTDVIFQNIWRIAFGTSSKNEEISGNDDLKKYEGRYASEATAALIRVEAVGNKLRAYVDGQTVYDLVMVKDGYFTVRGVNATVKFDRQQQQVLLEHDGKSVVFKKE